MSFNLEEVVNYKTIWVVDGHSEVGPSKKRKRTRKVDDRAAESTVPRRSDKLNESLGAGGTTSEGRLSGEWRTCAPSSTEKFTREGVEGVYILTYSGIVNVEERMLSVFDSIAL